MREPRDEAAPRIASWVEQNPHKPRPEEAWVLPRCVSVWAVITQLELDGWDRAGVAAYYGLPLDAVDAAVAYYHEHREALDARIARNRARLPA